MARRRRSNNVQTAPESETVEASVPEVVAAPAEPLEPEQEPEVVVVEEPEAVEEPEEEEEEAPDFGEGHGAQLRTALYNRARRFLDLLADAREQLTPDVVHQLRVTGRRLESTLGMLGALIGTDPVRKLKSDIKTIRRSLGDLRDLQRQLEVLAEEPLLDEYLTERSGQLPKTIRKAEKKLAKARPNKIEKQLELIDALVAALLQESEGEQNAREVLHNRVWETLLRAMARAEEVDPDHSFSYHPLRIAMKRFRYEAEVYAAAGWPTALDDNEGWDRLKQLHNALGTLQDIEVLACHLDLYWAESPPVREMQARLVNRFLKERNQALSRVNLHDLDWEQLWEWPHAELEEELSEDGDSAE